MTKIIARILKDNRLSWLIYTVSSILFAWMYIGMFPSIQGQAEQFMAAMKNYPKQMLDAIGVEITQASFTNVHSYLSMENFSMIWPIIVIAILGWLFGMAIYSLSLMISAMVSEKGKVVFLAVGLIVVMYALNVVASLKDSLKDLKYLSFFHYYDQQSAFVRNTIDWQSYALFGAVIIICTIIGALVFNQRDISV